MAVWVYEGVFSEEGGEGGEEAEEVRGGEECDECDGYDGYDGWISGSLGGVFVLGTCGMGYHSE